MKNIVPIKPVFFYIFIICVVAIGEAFAIKSTILPAVAHTIHNQESDTFTHTTPASNTPFAVSAANQYTADVRTDADSIEFDVEVVQPRKFFLSFTMKREETFFIKIYDIIGNLIHHEVVSKKDKFRKHYDLSKYKADLYVIEVGSGKKAKIKRLFLG